MNIGAVQRTVYKNCHLKLMCVQSHSSSVPERNSPKISFQHMLTTNNVVYLPCMFFLHTWQINHIVQVCYQDIQSKLNNAASQWSGCTVDVCI